MGVGLCFRLDAICKEKTPREDRHGLLDQVFNKNFVSRYATDLILLVSLSAFGLYLIRGIFSPGFLYYVDNSQHFEESVYVATVLLPQYHSLIGWNPNLYLGWPQGQSNPPASYLIYSGLYYILRPLKPVCR
jgi:hypothetical protein